MEKSKCPKCSSTEIGKGKLSGYANMAPVNKVFSMGSPIIAGICTNCGYILGLKVTSPENWYHLSFWDVVLNTKEGILKNYDEI